MARRGFRIHSRALYDPFSYQELMAPIETAQSAYNQMQDNMLTLGEEANVYKQLIDTDPYASGILKGYNDTLADLSNKLSNEGLKSVNRNTLLSVRRKYNNEVKPVNDAAKTLMGIQDMYRQAYAKDNTLMRGAMPSIRDLVENPGAMPHMVSGTSLYSQGAQAAKSASVRKQNFSAKVNELVRGYIHTVNTAGYNSVEAQQFLDEASRQPELQAIVNQIYGANQVGKLDNPQQGMDWIVRGVFDGLTYEQKDDLKYDQYAAEMRAAARAAAKSGSGSNGLGHVDKFNLYSQKDLSAAGKFITKHQDEFTQKADGTWELTEAGKRKFKDRSVTNETIISHGLGQPGQLTSRFDEALESVYGKKINNERDYVNAWTAYYDMYGTDTYDARKATGYRYVPQGDDAEIIKRLYGSHNNSGKIYTVDYNPKTGNYESDKEISANDIKTIGDIEMSGAGVIVNAGLSNGTSVKLKMPISGPRLSNIQDIILRDIDYTRENFVGDVQYLAENIDGRYADFVRNPEEAINYALSTGRNDIAQMLYTRLYDYNNSIQELYNEMANSYRATDSEVSKR